MAATVGFELAYALPAITPDVRAGGHAAGVEAALAALMGSGRANPAVRGLSPDLDLSSLRSP